MSSYFISLYYHFYRRHKSKNSGIVTGLVLLSERAITDFDENPFFVEGTRDYTDGKYLFKLKGRE